MPLRLALSPFFAWLPVLGMNPFADCSWRMGLTQTPIPLAFSEPSTAALHSTILASLAP